jgi:small subunit ribosomal protein S1
VVQALIEQTSEPAAGQVVAGSGGLLLEIDGQIVPNYDATLRPIEEGEVVAGKVVRIDKDEVLVDIGYKSEGVIPVGELSIRRAVDPNEEVALGEEIEAIVLTKEDQDGRMIVSKKRARFERAWRNVEEAARTGATVEGTVIEVVKGGLIIDLGIRGFLPASLVDIRRVPNLDQYLGTQMQAKVIELNRARNNVVLSRRAVLEEERKEVRQRIIDRLEPGMVVDGRISNVVDFGAFVDLDGIDGLIHISELSWTHIRHPSEVLTIGDPVQVKVLDIDRDRQRISLGLKQTQEDPWERMVKTYSVGDELEGRVTKVVPFGAFVEVLDGVEGLVHVSELATRHVENPREVVHPGNDLRVKILEIDSERRRLSLSAKRVEDQILPAPGAAEQDGDRRAEGQSSAEQGAEQLSAEQGAERSGAEPSDGGPNAQSEDDTGGIAYEDQRSGPGAAGAQAGWATEAPAQDQSTLAGGESIGEVGEQIAPGAENGPPAAEGDSAAMVAPPGEHGQGLLQAAGGAGED